MYMSYKRRRRGRMYKRTSLNDDEFISPKEKNRKPFVFERERDGEKKNNCKCPSVRQLETSTYIYRFGHGSIASGLFSSDQRIRKQHFLSGRQPSNKIQITYGLCVCGSTHISEFFFFNQFETRNSGRRFFFWGGGGGVSGPFFFVFLFCT